MKKKIVNGIRILVFLAVLTGVLTVVYRALSWKDTMGDHLSSFSQLYATPEDTIDLVFVGTSHVYCGLLPEILWQENGISAFNMSVSGTDKIGMYYSLVELLKTQSPEIVVVDLYSLGYEKAEVQSNIYRKLLGMKTSRNSIQMVCEDVEDSKEQLDYIFRWPIVHTRYRELVEEDFRQSEENVFGRGEKLWWGGSAVADPLNEAAAAVAEPLSDANRLWLDRLYDLSVEEGFQLCFMVVPFSGYPGFDAIIKGGIEYGEERDIPTFYGNMLTAEMGLDCNTDYIDNGHLNSFGAVKFTLGIRDFLLERYELVDHRSVEGAAGKDYHLWDDDLEWYKRQIKWDQLAAMDEYVQYLTTLTGVEDIVVLVSLQGDYLEKGADYTGLCEVMNLTEEEYQKGGVWLFHSGQFEKIYENDETAEPLVMDLSDYDSMRVRFRNDGYGGTWTPENLKIDWESYANNGYHLRITYYDLRMNQVVGSKGF